MGKTKGPYNAEYPIGSVVKIAERDALEDFMRTWKFHNKLRPQQLDYAGMSGPVKSVGFYHGGDELYQLEGMPGIWHECCLEAVTPPS
jgi:hypothetical protein